MQMMKEERGQGGDDWRRGDGGAGALSLCLSGERGKGSGFLASEGELVQSVKLLKCKG